MPYLFDTNICIYLIKHKPAYILDKFNSIEPGQIAVSAITCAELEYGVQKSDFIEKNAMALRKFLLALDILDFDWTAAMQYGYIRHYLQSKGKPIGAMDFLIAAQALAKGYTLVTNNTKEFERIPGLLIENWVNQ